MSFILKGRLTDASDPPEPLPAYTVEFFDKDLVFDVFGDDPIGSAVTLDDGTFRIDFRKEDFKKPGEFWESVMNEPDLYVKVYDPERNFLWDPNNVNSNATIALTISALAFRIAESIVTLSNLPVEQVTVGTKTVYFPR
jgi:hypothetical protein